MGCRITLAEAREIALEAGERAAFAREQCRKLEAEESITDAERIAAALEKLLGDDERKVSLCKRNYSNGGPIYEVGMYGRDTLLSALEAAVAAIEEKL